MNFKENDIIFSISTSKNKGTVELEFFQNPLVANSPAELEFIAGTINQAARTLNKLLKFGLEYFCEDVSDATQIIEIPPLEHLPADMHTHGA